MMGIAVNRWWLTQLPKPDSEVQDVGLREQLEEMERRGWCSLVDGVWRVVRAELPKHSGKRRVRIMTQGTPQSTEVVDVHTGAPITDRCVGFRIQVAVGRPNQVEVVLDGFAVDLDAVVDARTSSEYAEIWSEVTDYDLCEGCSVLPAEFATADDVGLCRRCCPDEDGD